MDKNSLVDGSVPFRHPLLFSKQGRGHSPFGLFPPMESSMGIAKGSSLLGDPLLYVCGGFHWRNRRPLQARSAQEDTPPEREDYRKIGKGDSIQPDPGCEFSFFSQVKKRCGFIPKGNKNFLAI